MVVPRASSHITGTYTHLHIRTVCKCSDGSGVFSIWNNRNIFFFLVNFTSFANSFSLMNHQKWGKNFKKKFHLIFNQIWRKKVTDPSVSGNFFNTTHMEGILRLDMYCMYYYLREIVYRIHT